MAAHPESGIAQRYKRLGISVRQGEKWKGRLVRGTWIAEAKETTRTGSIRRIRLTEKGRGILKESQTEDPDQGADSGGTGSEAAGP